MRYFQYKLTSNALCMGERMKAGIFRPCANTIRYSQITGALKNKFGRDKKIHAVGFLEEKEGFNQREYYIYSPRDKVQGKSKVPLQIEYLTEVLGTVFISGLTDVPSFPPQIHVAMGALISKGFGECEMQFVGEIEVTEDKLPVGLLNVRLPVDDVVREAFQIKAIINPVYGYLYKPLSLSKGSYVLSLFENSLVSCPEFLQKRSTNGKRERAIQSKRQC